MKTIEASSSYAFRMMYKDEPVVVHPLNVNNSRIYRVLFGNGNSLILVRAMDFDGSPFWTSVPEGKQQVAQEIGNLISDHISK